MPKIYGHTKQTAERLTEMANASQMVSQPSLISSRRPQIINFGVEVFRTPEGGIPAFSGVSLGKASCSLGKVYDDAGTYKVQLLSPAESHDVCNIATYAVPGEVWIQVVRINGVRLLIPEGISNLRVDGTNLQYLRYGDWVTWNEGTEDCPPSGPSV